MENIPNKVNKTDEHISIQKKIVYYILMCLLVVAIVEVALRGVSHIVKHYIKPQEGDSKALTSPYIGADWVKEYFEEFEESDDVFYKPFIEWRRKSYSGKYISISNEGIRKTWNPKALDEQNDKIVYCFGGSTMWGTGARNDFTIPSILSKKLNANEQGYFVVNRGESAYTLTQEIVDLVLLLKKGKRPDYVIFYDGVNDIYAAYQSGKSGRIHNEQHIREKLSPDKKKKPKKSLVDVLEDKFEICRVILRAKSIIAPKNEDAEKKLAIEGVIGSTYSDEELTMLAEDIIADYNNSMKFIKMLSETYGFKYLFIWQPVLYTCTALTSEELGFSSWEDKRRVKLYKITYDLMLQNKKKYFYNISTVFDSKKKSMFIDFCHPCEEGNEIIADELFRQLISLE